MSRLSIRAVATVTVGAAMAASSSVGEELRQRLGQSSGDRGECRSGRAEQQGMATTTLGNERG
jgi:hypothetical protein